MKIFVLGHSGMLGRYVFDYFRNKGYEVNGLSRNKLDASKITEPALRAILDDYSAEKDDVIINCMGVIKSVIDARGTIDAIKVNSLFPHMLGALSKEMGYKMIHITTDCVFSGNDGNYTEDSLHDCTDVYGKTKSLGEPTSCTVIRTSIIGDEVTTNRSLIEWVKSQRGNEINGYLNHHWNGMTCFQTAKVFEDIITHNKFWGGVRHIFSPNSLTKHELVSAIAKTYDLDIKITPHLTQDKCDRTLSTTYVGANHPDTFNIPDIEDQIDEQKDNPPPIYV